jgi:RNA-dependent RNA polymerase
MINNNNNSSKLTYNLSKYIEFGTFCTTKTDTFFYPFAPIDKAEFVDNKLIVDSHGYRTENISLFISKKNNRELYKIEIKHYEIENIELHCHKDDENDKTFFIHLNNPPKVFKKIKEDKLITPLKNYTKQHCKFVETLDYKNHYHLINKSGFHEINLTGKETTEYVEEDEVISYQEMDEISEFNSYVRMDSFLSTYSEFSNFYLLNLILKIKINFNSVEEYNDFLYNLHLHKKVEEKRTINSISSKEEKSKLENLFKMKEKEFYKIFTGLHFNLQYSLLSLITQRRLNMFSFDLNLMYRLKDLDCDDQDKAAMVIDSIHKETNANSNKLLDIFNKYFQSYIGEEPFNDENLMKVRTVEVTPSIIKYKPMLIERVNHILRKYKDYRNHFIKVNFVSEDCRKVGFSFNSMWVILSFMKTIMQNHLLVGTRSFRFLSSSNSQMKNCSFWFFCLEGTRFDYIEQIINELGDFSEEENIHKNAARRGQCLSTTTCIKELKPQNIALIDDITRNGHIFTDGIGQISIDLALLCSKKFDLNYSSAFQIRIGGIKGIVAVNPELKGEQILVRPSMMKFKSNDTELGVIRCSSYSQGYLNRQIITLLSTLGVSNEIFIAMLEKNLNKCTNLINNPNEVILVKKDLFMQKCCHFSKALSYFAYNNYNIRQDPFFSSLTQVTAISKIFDLKQKGKILDKKSAVLLGVIDETDSLQEGEVFIKLKSETFKTVNNIQIVKSDVLVTKNPCLHPGDIKVLKAVSCDKLTHMVNVIVFSAKGNRPIQNEISGGDLDGDAYFISWNLSLIHNLKILNYSSLEDNNKTLSKKKSTTIKLRDIINSYIDYMKSDTIALISNLHSAYADSSEDGAMNEKCLKLAQLFLTSIDAPKTGNFIESSDLKQFKINTYPDYLEMPSYSYYKSPGILGELYRYIDVNKHIADYEYNEYRFNYLEEYTMITSLITDGAHEYVLRAYDIYCRYRNEMVELMKNAKVLTESEFFIGENIYDKKRAKQNKFSDWVNEIKTIKDKYRDMILNSFSNVNVDVASAFYVVTYINNKTIDRKRDFFMKHKNYRILIDSLIKDKRVAGGIMTYKGYEVKFFKPMTFEEYQRVIYSNRDSNHHFISRKRIFSLPWLIREIKDKLLTYS